MKRQKRKNSEKGQALLEYMFLTVFVVLFFGSLITRLASDNRSIGMCRYWAVIVRSIATPCANCDRNNNLNPDGGNPVCYNP